MSLAEKEKSKLGMRNSHRFFMSPASSSHTINNDFSWTTRVGRASTCRVSCGRRLAGEGEKVKGKIVLRWGKLSLPSCHELKPESVCDVSTKSFHRASSQCAAQRRSQKTTKIDECEMENAVATCSSVRARTPRRFN